MQLVRTADPIIAACANATEVVVDTETSSLHPHRDGKILAGVGVKPVGSEEGFYLTVRHQNGGANAPLEEVRKLDKALKDKRIIYHNAKYDLAVLWNDGLDLVDHDTADTVVTWRLISENEPSYKLKTLGRKYVFPEAGDLEKKLKAAMRKYGWVNYMEIPAELILPYVAEDLDLTEALYQKSWPVIEKRHLEEVFELEMLTTQSLFEMERIGFKVNTRMIGARHRSLTKRTGELGDEIYSIVHKSLLERKGDELADDALLCIEEPSKKRKVNTGAMEFSIVSHHDCKRVLRGMGLKSELITPKGAESWDKKALALLDHPIAKMIVSWRELKNVLHFYESFIELKDADGAVHPSIKQAGTRTGRCACVQPNLQQIPKDNMGDTHAKIEMLAGRTADEEAEVEAGYRRLGRQRIVDAPQGDSELKRVREVFIPRDGYFLLLADWSQVELRVMADYAREMEWINAFKLGLDIHALAALGAYGALPDDASPRQREWWRAMGKQINFGLIYGMGLKLLAVEIGDGLDTTRAKRFMNSYFARFSSVNRFRNQVVPNRLYDRMQGRCVSHNYVRCTECTEYVERGWVANRWGRRRYLTMEEQYKSVNFLVQGTSADLMKDTINRLHEALLDTGIRMLITIHDELIFEVPYSDKPAITKHVKLIVDQMERCDKIKHVPLRTELKWSPKNWSHATSLSCDECSGHGLVYPLSEEEMFSDLANRDWTRLRKLEGQKCKECDGRGYRLGEVYRQLQVQAA